jgi:SprT protein
VSKDKKQSIDYFRINSREKLEKALESIIRKFDLDIEPELEIAGRFKRKAGQYQHKDRKIRISKYLLENHPEKVITTLKHELGHAIVMNRYQRKKIKPHGKEWRSVMSELGVDKPEVCHRLQLAKYRYIVRCSNTECNIELGRHKKSRLVKKPDLYICKECGSSFESFEVRKDQ